MKIASRVFEIVLMRAVKTVVSDVNEIDDAILLPDPTSRQPPCFTEAFDGNFRHEVNDALPIVGCYPECLYWDVMELVR